MNGWIRLSRKIFDCWLWNEKPFTKAQAWIDLLLLANYETRKFVLGNELVEVERGSFITSEVKLMKRWGWGKGKTRAFLSLLESDSMIIKNSNRKRTTITIVNYDKYQLQQTTDGLITDYERTDNGLLSDTTNKYNNINNINKKERAAKFTPPTLEEVRAYCQERNNKVIPESFISFYECKGWMVGKNKMKDWKACVRTWEQRDNQKTVANTKIHNFTEREYDYDDLEKRLVKN